MRSGDKCTTFPFRAARNGADGGVWHAGIDMMLQQQCTHLHTIK